MPNHSLTRSLNSVSLHVRLVKYSTELERLEKNKETINQLGFARNDNSIKSGLKRDKTMGYFAVKNTFLPSHL